MLLVDAHCDTISVLLDKDKKLYSNDLHLDIERLRHLGSYVQFFAAFVDPIYGSAYAMKRAVAIIDKYYSELEDNNNYIMHCNNFVDIEKTINDNKIASILSIEGGEALLGQIASLRIFFKLGVRSICLTWNYRNEIADGVLDSSSGGGLTPFGFKVISEMNHLGMLIDLSHISKRGFNDVLSFTKSPVIVSHSNSRKLCNHKRNLDDWQLKAVKRNGGAIGINFYPDFLHESGTASIKDIVKHIEYMSGLIGTDYIGLGSDFDGIEKTPVDLCGVQSIYRVIDELGKLNYSDEDIKKISGLNFLRVIKEVLK